MPLLISNYFSGDALAALALDRVCAVLLDEPGNALRNTGICAGDYWEMDVYEAASHNDFCIPISAHDEISKYGYVSIDDDDFELADTPIGQLYRIEFWYRDNDVAFDRSVDELIEVRSVYWRNNQFTYTDLTLQSARQILLYTVNLSAVYSQTDETLKLMCWLSVNGITDKLTTNVQFTLRDFDETEIFAITLSSHAALLPGIFKYEYEVELDPDQIYILNAVITDEHGVDRDAYIDIISLD